MSVLRIHYQCFGLIQKWGLRYTSAYKYHMILHEPQPDDIRTVVGGEPVVVPPKPKLTGMIESHNPDEWKFVEAVMPRKVVPEPPKHNSYPTPSGWVPPKEHTTTPYVVHRTRFHNFPVYLYQTDGGSRMFTTICKVNGDIWQLDEDVRRYLTDATGKKTYTRVDEVCQKLWVRGKHLELLSKFLIEKGM